MVYFSTIAGLGYSEMAQYYAIRNREEAIAFFGHPVLGKRLVEISEAFLVLKETSASRV